MTECQKNLLRLLKEIDKICVENDIEYRLAGGTYIGAVRHGGFLPWDDDADIHMTRENVEKFIAVSETAFPPGRAVVRQKEFPHYPNPIWRYTSYDTTALQRSGFIEDMPKGVYVDIILLQPVPDDESTHKRYLEDWEAYTEITTETYMLYSRRPPFVIDQFWKSRQSPQARQQLEEKLFSELTSTKEADTNTFLILSQYMCNFFTKEDFGGTKRVPFEDTELSIFGNAEGMLCKAYGENWFEIPLSAERESHVTVYDYDVPYTVYEKDYKSWFDTEEAHAALKEKKDKWMSILDSYNYVQPRTHTVIGAAVTLEIEQFVRERGIDVVRWVEEGKYADLLSLFANYYNTQRNDPHKYWGTYLDMPDDLLYGAWYPVAVRGRYREAMKYIDARRNASKEPLSAELNGLYEKCQRVGDFLKAVYTDFDDEAAKEALQDLLQIFPDQIHVRRGEIQYMLKEGKPLPEIKEKLAAAMALHPDDGELMKYQGDLYLRQGDPENAKRMYRKCRSFLTNGMILKGLEQEIAAVDDSPVELPEVAESAAAEPAETPAPEEVAVEEPAETPAPEEPVAEEPAETPVPEEPATAEA